MQRSSQPAPSELDLKRRVAIGRFFSERREQRGLDRATVAESVGIDSAELLAAYEDGRTAMPMEHIFALTNHLNIPPEDVLSLIYDIT